jgi:hypothetical protein
MVYCGLVMATGWLQTDDYKFEKTIMVQLSFYLVIKFLCHLNAVWSKCVIDSQMNS